MTTNLCLSAMPQEARTLKALPASMAMVQTQDQWEGHLDKAQTIIPGIKSLKKGYTETFWEMMHMTESFSGDLALPYELAVALERVSKKIEMLAGGMKHVLQAKHVVTVQDR